MKRYVLPLLVASSLWPDTIEEKLVSSQTEDTLSPLLEEYNDALPRMKAKLKERYKEARNLVRYGADEGEYKALLKEINELKGEVEALEESWRQAASSELKSDDHQFSFWDQDDPSLGQLVMDYGSSDYLYIIPPDISNMKIHLHSGFPIPRESWGDLLEIILAQNGIGIRELNSYARSLYVMKQDLSAVKAIVSDEQGLASVSSDERIIYIFTPVPERIKGVTQFFERFRDPKKCFIYQVGYKIAIISTKDEVEKLLTLYNAVWEKENEKVTKVLSISRLSVKDMEKVLSAYFSQSSKLGRVALMKGEGDDLTIIPLAHEGALVLIGAKEMVEKGEKIIVETEKQILDPCEMTVYSYTCRHADPVEVCDVLEKVYASLVFSKVEGQETVQVTAPVPMHPHFPPNDGGEEPPHPVQSVVTTTQPAPSKEKGTTVNFIPYAKSGSIMMVVRHDALEKIQEILRKLDVPKKMVQIEVLLFEKKASSKHNSGINLLQLGTNPDRKSNTSVSFSKENRGVLEFLISRTKKHSPLPGFDIAYNFLMGQEGVRINASPSVTTLNQTPGQIKLVEERSINEGVAKVDDKYAQKYSRAQYGTTISITPTIHEPEVGLDETMRFVTLETDITFETVSSDKDDRPNVVRRHIENQVRIKDGETLILGGLKRKTGEDSSEKIPFLGEIPGIGKLFGSSKTSSEETEMFIFITPKIILDPQDEFEKVRNEELMRRPGDVPEFLSRAKEAKGMEREKLFSNSVKMLFGNENR